MASKVYKDIVQHVLEDTIEKYQKAIPEIQKKLMERIVKDTDQYVPYKTGNLAESVEISTVPPTITYKADYASYAFDPETANGEPKQYTKDVHPLAQGNPIEQSVLNHESEWVAFIEEELRNVK